MIHAKAARHSEPHRLMEVLHRMTMKSHITLLKSLVGMSSSKTLSMESSLPSGDPPEVMLWGAN